MSPGATTIRIPFSTTIKPQQSNCEPSYERGCRVPDALRTHPGSGHPTDSGRRFHDAKDSDVSSRRNLTLNRLEACDGHDGCDGRSVEFYGYTRLRQPNDTLTGHVDRTRQQDTFGTSTESSLARVWVSIVSTPSEDIVSTPSEEFGSTPSDEFGSTSASSGWVRVNIGIMRMSSGQPVAKPRRDRHTVWYLYCL